MAQKRMFDRAVLDKPDFLDLSLTAKALYFLLGMEADDEGFVVYRKVTKLHGFSDDDLRNLAEKDFIIPFQNGVIVITDWHKNNWLDNRRSRMTEFSKEKKLLTLTRSGKYVLSTCLASIEENRIEKNSLPKDEYGILLTSEEKKKRLDDMREALQSNFKVK